MPMDALLMGTLAAVAMLLIVYGVAGGSADPVEARLQDLRSTGAHSLQEFDLQKPFFDRTVRPLMGRLSGTAGRFTSTSFTTQTQKRLAMAGSPGDVSVGDWLGLKLLISLAAMAGTVVLALILRTSPFLTLMFGLAAFGIAYVVPEFWLRRCVKDRQRRIVRALPDSLDLLTISVRAGLGFDAALTKVVEKTRGPLAEEFRRALAELRIGRSRRDSLRDIIPRTEVPALTSFIGAILQAEQLGVAISKVLQVQSEQLRIRRRQHAEEMAAKAPVKMLFPLIGCIFPSLFIVILGPALIVMLQGFGTR